MTCKTRHIIDKIESSILYHPLLLRIYFHFRFILEFVLCEVANDSVERRNVIGQDRKNLSRIF